MEYNEEPIENPYGINLQTVYFSNEKGAELIFNISQRVENKSFDEMIEYVYRMKSESLDSFSEEERVIGTDYGKIFVSGYYHDDDDQLCETHVLVKVEQEYILQMTVNFPPQYSYGDGDRYGCIMDNLYRMCGSSESSNPIINVEGYNVETDADTQSEVFNEFLTDKIPIEIWEEEKNYSDLCQTDHGIDAIKYLDVDNDGVEELLIVGGDFNPMLILDVNHGKPVVMAIGEGWGSYLSVTVVDGETLMLYHKS